MLKHPKGLEVLKKLIGTCDVVQHNMRYPAVERMGMDYASLKDEFPRLIYCHSRGFEDGPRKNLPGNDQTGACLAGIQHEDGALHTGEGHPVWSLTSLGDTGNGFLSASAICQALMEREKTGKGTVCRYQHRQCRIAQHQLWCRQARWQCGGASPSRC